MFFNKLSVHFFKSCNSLSRLKFLIELIDPLKLECPESLILYLSVILISFVDCDLPKYNLYESQDMDLDDNNFDLFKKNFFLRLPNLFNDDDIELIQQSSIDLNRFIDIE